MGLKEIVLGAAVSLAAAGAMADDRVCAGSCTYPTFLTCTAGQKGEMKPYKQTHKTAGTDEIRVETYLLKVGQRGVLDYEHVSFIPAERVAVGILTDGGIFSTSVQLIVDSPPYGSIDDSYDISQSTRKAIGFAKEFPQMLAKAHAHGGIRAYFEQELARYHAPPDSDLQRKYQSMVDRAEEIMATRPCIGASQFVRR